MTVAELGRRMSSAEFSDWQRFHDVEPFGPEREDQRASVVAALLANAYRDPKRRPQPYAPSDLLPTVETSRPVQPVSILDKVRQWADRHNAMLGQGKRKG